MKPQVCIAVLICLFACSCNYPRYLTRAGNVGENPYGGYIKCTVHPVREIRGELIAVTKDSLYIMEEYELSPSFIKEQGIGQDSATTNARGGFSVHNCISIPTNQIWRFKIRFMYPKFGASIPISAALAATHGWAAIGTLVLNVVVTAVLTSRSGYYTSRHLSYEELRAFSRYPQGLPEGVNRNQIK